MNSSASADTVAHALGDLVQMKINPELTRMVTGIMFRPTGAQFYVTWENAEETAHFDIELRPSEKTFDTEKA